MDQKSALRRQVVVTMLVPETSNSMKRFKVEQDKKPAPGRGVAQMDFIKDNVTSWVVVNLDEADVTDEFHQGQGYKLGGC